MKLAGITKVRNEGHIMQDTLDHFGQHCDAIYVYDDCSTDNTVEICLNHPKVKNVIIGTSWNPDRYEAEYQNRQAVFEVALKDDPEWFIYFDADERLDIGPVEKIDTDQFTKVDGIVMRFFDYYITDEDKNLAWKNRRWIGPEYRDILMMFRADKTVGYCLRDQREALLRQPCIAVTAGYVRHYGKAISVEDWERKCEYYSTHFPEPYKSKWEGRKNKAVHTKSDFGRALITWDEKDEKGCKL